MSSLPTVPSSSSRDANAFSETSELSLEDQAVLAQAMRELERTSLAIRLSAIIGRQVSAIGSIIPANISEIANKAAEAAIRSVLNFSFRSLAKTPLRDRRGMHKSLAVLAGAAGGAFGFSGLTVELPFSTTIMLRSIADIARGEGEYLSDPKTALACLEVFALGGRADADKNIRFPEIDVADYNFEKGAALETGYFSVRALLAKSVTEAASYLSGRGVLNEVAPALIRLVAQIGSHFGVVVSQKLVAQSVPLIGAAGGAAINYAFADHFQTTARGHFTILRLERQYGVGVVRAEYERLLNRA